jgi:hypothetical protein
MELIGPERHPARMIATQREFPSVASCCRHVFDPADFVALDEPTTQLVVWRRPVDPVLQRFANDVLAADELQSAQEIEVGDLATFDPLPAAARAADPAAAAAFTDDVRELAQMFALLTGASRLGLRLVRLDGPMCPRFHTDFVGVRLLTTYSGTGTEWLEHEHVDRRFLGHRSGGREDHESGLLRPGAVVQRLPLFAVGLLKGEAWPGNRERGIVHRSPGGREPRILLSLDVSAQGDGGGARFDGFDASGRGHEAPAEDQHGDHDGHGCGGTCGGGR